MEIYIAGAGAGKTTTMANNIIKLREEIEEYKIIFCITFTNNATSCIKSKLINYYGVIPKNILVSTIHSFLYQQFIRPYYFLLYEKQYEQISTVDLPSVPMHKNKKIKSLDDRNILHQTVIPERAKWIIYQKSRDTKSIKDKRKIINKIFADYCGAICIDEAQDIDSDMRIIIEKFCEMGIYVLLMGDPKQDLKGHKSLRTLVEKYKDTVCHRCPKEHLNLSNFLVNSQEKQQSDKVNGIITLQFETEKSCIEVMKQGSFDLAYISKKQGKFDTHQAKRKDGVLNLAEEIEAIIQVYHKSVSKVILKRFSYYYAEKLIENYNNTNDKKKALLETFKKYEKFKREEYIILMNSIPEPEHSSIVTNEKVIVSSIDSIKGQEGENCLFVLTTDLAAYLFGNKKDENVTKSRLYVALTRSLDKLTIFITEEVEKKYTRNTILDFFKTYLRVL